MRHREIDRADTERGRPLGKPAGEPNRRLRPPGVLDLLPGECARNAEAECLADRLLACEAARVALRRIRARVAVGALRLGEAPLAEARVPRERPADPLDLDQVG